MHEAKRRRQRRMWIIFCLLLLAGGGYLGYRLFAIPQLRPVTSRTLPRFTSLRFSANGADYPALEVNWVESKRYVAFYHNRWLDNTCRPVGKQFTTLFESPIIIDTKREVATYVKYENYHSWDSHPIMLNTVIWRGGRREPLTRHPEYALDQLPQGYQNSQSFLYCDDWHHAVYYRRASPTGPVYDLYDRQQKRALFSFTPQFHMPGMVFHQGDRFVLVQREGMTQVFEKGKLLRKFGSQSTVWNWSEDGTVWMVNKMTLRVLIWRKGVPVMVSLSSPVYHDKRVIYIQNPMPGRSYMPAIPDNHPSLEIAAWGDGQLVACTKTKILLPHTVDRLFTLLGSRFTRLSNTPREARVLMLYRKGKQIGRLIVKLPYIPPTPIPASTIPFRTTSGFRSISSVLLPREHLAFTGDGRYLSWVIMTKKGTTVYVFRVKN